MQRNCFCCMRVTTLLLMALLTMTSVVRSEECGQEEFSKCAEPLEMLNLSPKFSIGAGKKEDLDKLCRELHKGVRCIQSFTRRCMDLQQRNHFNTLYHGTNRFIRDLCSEGKFQDDYLKNAACSEMAKKDFELCANRYKETMVFLQPNKNQENGTATENIKTICCSITELTDCSENAARTICGNEAAKFTHQLVEKYTSSLTRIYCGDFTRHPEKCRDDNGSGAGTLRQQNLMALLAVLLLLLFR